MCVRVVFCKLNVCCVVMSMIYGVRCCVCCVYVCVVCVFVCLCGVVLLKVFVCFVCD